MTGGAAKDRLPHDFHTNRSERLPDSSRNRTRSVGPARLLKEKASRCAVTDC
jgi:hypothetical protein